MTAHHIGKQTHGESCRFGEHTEYFDKLHDGEKGELEPHGHVGPEHFEPVMLGGEDVCNQEGECSQGESNGDIAGEVSTAGEYHNQAQNVHKEDEEEHCEQIWGEAATVRAEYLLNHALVDESEE